VGVRRVLSLVVGVVMGWGVAARLARLREQKRRAGRRHGTSPSDCLYHTHSLALSALTRLLRRSLPRLSLTDEITKYRTPNTSSPSPASWPSSSPSTGAPSQRRAREVPGSSHARGDSFVGRCTGTRVGCVQGGGCGVHGAGGDAVPHDLRQEPVDADVHVGAGGGGGGGGG